MARTILSLWENKGMKYISWRRKIHQKLNKTTIFKVTKQHIQKYLNQEIFPQEKLEALILFGAGQMSLPWAVPTFILTQVIHLRVGSDWVPEILLLRKARIWGAKDSSDCSLQDCTLSGKERNSNVFRVLLVFLGENQMGLTWWEIL